MITSKSFTLHLQTMKYNQQTPQPFASKDARSGKPFFSLAAGIFLALLFFTTAVEAQCPADGDSPIPIPGENNGNTASNWVTSTIIYNIPGTDCWIDITICKRDITGHAQSGDFSVGSQYFISRIDIDPISDGACD